MGGIYSGFFTATTAAAVGAFGAFLLVLFRRGLSIRQLGGALEQTGATTASIFMIVIGGTLFARLLTYTGVIDPIAQTLTTIDGISIMVLVLPAMFPVLHRLGYDPIWLGIITIQLGEIGAITPPVGLNVYVVQNASPVALTLEEVFQGITPFLILDFIMLAVLILFPQIALVLPELMS